MITTHSLKQHANSISSYMPGGPLFRAKFIEGSTIRRLIEGLAVEVANAEDFLKLLQDEFLPDKTTLLLSEWEKLLGIPDDCLPLSDDDDIRRQFILIKLASLGVQTVDDFQNLADLFGVTATVIPGLDAIPVPPDPKFTIVIEFVAPDGFPYTFPFTFGSDTIAILECLFNKLKPANCVTVFTQI